MGKSREWGIGSRESGSHIANTIARFLFCALSFATTAAVPQTTDAPAPDHSPLPIPDSRPHISLLTIGPGELYFERFGHNAIVVREAGRPALAYNYGIFDFAQENFLLNFARGHMLYRIAVGTLEDDLAMYRAERRSMVEQQLDLDAAQARALVAFLEDNARPENAQYRYEYFAANCSTRVRDALDRALGGTLRTQSEGRSRGYSYRLDALRLMTPEPWLMLGIDLGLGPSTDQRIDYWQESFVPETLRDVVSRMTLIDAAGQQRPLVTQTVNHAIGEIEEPPALPPDLRIPFLLLGLALGTALLWLARGSSAARRVPLVTFALVFELFCGIGGLLLLFLWFGTEHYAAWANENLLLLSPLCLALLPAWFGIARGRRRPRRVAAAIAWLIAFLAAIALFSKILPWFVQANLHWIVLLLPIHLALAVVLQREAQSAKVSGMRDNA
jgi:hypothetical protein